MPESVPKLRRKIVSFAESVGMAGIVLEDLELAVSEAVSNSVVHAFVGRKPGRITVSADCTGEVLDLVVEDDGSGLQPRPDSPGLGLGLPLISKVASSFSVSTAARGGTRLVMSFPIGGSS